VNLVVYGVTAPFAASLMEHLGVRRTAAWALALVAAGTALTTVMTEPWQLYLLWGLLVGVGTGSVALVFGAIVVNRWFERRRGLVLGILGSAWATGQLIFLPILARVTDRRGWEATSLTVTVLAVVLIPVVLLVLRDRPADLGLAPYGASEVVADVPADVPAEAAGGTGGAWRAASGAATVLREVAGIRAFLLLAGTFFVCGWTTNGIISTHFVPSAHDHGMGATTAAGLLAVVGLFDIAGTLGSGWLTDRVDPRLLLGVYYGLRGLALLAVPTILGPSVEPPLVLVVALFGLDWVATVPPTVTLCRMNFGVERGGIVFGWVFAAHMVGAGIAAMASGALRHALGTYTVAWLLAALLAVAAAIASTAIPRGPAARPDLVLAAA